MHKLYKMANKYLISSYSNFLFEILGIFSHPSWQTIVDCPQPSAVLNPYNFLSHLLSVFLTFFSFLDLCFFNFALLFTAWLQLAARSLEKTRSTNIISAVFLLVYIHLISLFVHICHFFSFSCFLPVLTTI